MDDKETQFATIVDDSELGRVVGGLGDVNVGGGTNQDAVDPGRAGRRHHGPPVQAADRPWLQAGRDQTGLRAEAHRLLGRSTARQRPTVCSSR